MHHVHLTSFEDEPSGSLGMGILGYTSHPNLYADTTGQLIAHDIVDHQNGIRNIGSPQDELEAMGGFWFSRGRHGYTGNPNSIYTPAQSIGLGDLITIAEDTSYSDWVPRIGAYNTKPHDHDEDFHEILNITREALPRNLDPEDFPDFPTDAFLDNALHLMRIGFNKARRRFRDSNFLALDTYNAIKEAIAPHAPTRPSPEPDRPADRRHLRAHHGNRLHLRSRAPPRRQGHLRPHRQHRGPLEWPEDRREPRQRIVRRRGRPGLARP